MITAANRPPQLPVYCMEVNTDLSPGPTDIFFSVLPKINEMKYSFQIFIKLKIATVIIPGCASGIIIFQNVFIGEHPSIAAASSYVLDRLLKKVSRNVVVNGTCIPMYNNIRMSFVPVRCACVASPNSGSTIIICGMLIATTKLVFSVRFPKKENLEIA